jgi:hypothetical protein
MKNGQYAGTVIAVREKNGYHDSDFLALVPGPSGGFGWVETGTTRFGGGFVATVDATDDVIDAYEAWHDTKVAEVREAQAQYDARKIGVGSTVRVIGGRKHKGKTGTVTWFGKDEYARSKIATHFRVGIVPTDGDGERFFVPARYVEVEVDGAWVEPENAIEIHNGFGSGASPTAVAWAMGMYPRPADVRVKAAQNRQYAADHPGMGVIE